MRLYCVLELSAPVLFVQLKRLSLVVRVASFPFVIQLLLSLMGSLLGRNLSKVLVVYYTNGSSWGKLGPRLDRTRGCIDEVLIVLLVFPLVTL